MRLEAISYEQTVNIIPTEGRLNTFFKYLPSTISKKQSPLPQHNTYIYPVGGGSH